MLVTTVRLLQGQPTIQSCSVMTMFTLVLLLGLLPHWSSYQPLMINLPDELVHSNLTMICSLVELPKGVTFVAAVEQICLASLRLCPWPDGALVLPNALEPRYPRIRVSPRQGVTRLASRVGTVLLHHSPRDVPAREPRLHCMDLTMCTSLASAMRFSSVLCALPSHVPGRHLTSNLCSVRPGTFQQICSPRSTTSPPNGLPLMTRSIV